MRAGESGVLYLRVLYFGKGETSTKGGEPYMKKKEKGNAGINLITLSKLLRAFASLLKVFAELIRAFK